MFATCIFCHNALGTNEALEHFPVGKRLAFDAAKGRLWVVCPKCERWNLSPLEERWEAIEEGERAYRDTNKRVATDNIGLARLADGTEIVRVGAPLRPEFAAWRYGDQFGRRRRRQLLIGGGTVTVAAGILLAGPAMGLAIGGAGSGLLNAYIYSNALVQVFVPRAHIRDETGRDLAVSNRDIRRAKVLLSGRDRPLSVEFPYREWSPTGPLLKSFGITKRPNAIRSHPALLEGDAALRAMAAFLPALNGSGGSASQVARAVEAVEAHRNALPALVKQAINAQPFFGPLTGKQPGTMATIPKALRLALEMAVHEDDERRALEGELHELQQRWKAAEEIAAIADSLTLPRGVSERIDTMRKR